MRELGKNYIAPEHNRRRSLLSEKRDALIANADDMLRKRAVHAKDVHFVTIANALLDAGKIIEAVDKYAKALEKPSSPYECASHRRSHGHALMLSEDVHLGRQEMRKSAKEFIALCTSPKYDATAMTVQAAETLKRLIYDQLQMGPLKDPRVDFENRLVVDFYEFIGVFKSISKASDRTEFHLAAVDLKYRVEEALGPNNGHLPISIDGTPHNSRVLSMGVDAL